MASINNEAKDLMEQLLSHYKELAEDKAYLAVERNAPQPESVELNPNIIGCCWFSGRSSVCVVIVYSEHEDTGLVDADGNAILGGPKAYIGSVKGISEEHDMNETADWGAKFPLKIAAELIDNYGGWLKTSKLDWRPRAKTNSPLKFNLKYKGSDDKSE